MFSLSRFIPKGQLLEMHLYRTEFFHKGHNTQMTHTIIDEPRSLPLLFFACKDKIADVPTLRSTTLRRKQYEKR